MTARQVTCVAIGGRGVLIEGPPGSGKSTLALSLIDRGGVLVGDDGVMIEASEGAAIARPHPNTHGLIEVRNLGLVRMPVCASTRVCLVVRLDPAAPRFIEKPDTVKIKGVTLPLVRLWPDDAVNALKVELALERHG